MPKATNADEALKRLGGGRWQTRDERFTIEPQSGTWVVVDAEQTDELGLALVRGPFGSLGAAKTAIAAARDTEPAASPLSARAETIRARPQAKANASKRSSYAESPATPASPDKAKGPAKPAAPTEPRWTLALDAAERRRANRLIDQLTDAGAPDPEGIARRDIVGEVPATAAFALARALANLGDKAGPEQVAELLAGGRDEELGVRWRLVDGDGRPITIDLEAAGRGQRKT